MKKDETVGESTAHNYRWNRFGVEITGLEEIAANSESLQQLGTSLQRRSLARAARHVNALFKNRALTRPREQIGDMFTGSVLVRAMGQLGFRTSVLARTMEELARSPTRTSAALFDPAPAPVRVPPPADDLTEADVEWIKARGTPPVQEDDEDERPHPGMYL